MGSVSLKIGDGTARFRRATFCSSAVHIIMLFSVLTTNLFALYAFTYTSSHTHDDFLQRQQKQNANVSSIISEHIVDILRQIDTSQKKLAQIERSLLGYDTLDLSKPNTPTELKLFLAPLSLPLGRDSRTGITQMVSSVAHSCAQSNDLLTQYMSYNPGSICPDDASLAQRLLSRGCEPLPRRRCLSRKVLVPGIVGFPMSLWKPVSEKIVGEWNGFDKLMWMKSRGKNDFLVDEVLQLGGGVENIRLGFDLEGGSGNFAARMAEKGVTVVTSTLNSGGNPVSSFVAARGLFPLEMTPEQRFPFHESIFDLIHTVNGLNDDLSDDGLGRPEKLEFLMFDLDRILRPGGLLWLDNYYCADEKKKTVIITLIDKFSYKKLKWVVGEKISAAGNGKPKVFLSAVLQKPARGGG